MCSTVLQVNHSEFCFDLGFGDHFHDRIHFAHDSFNGGNFINVKQTVIIESLIDNGLKLRTQTSEFIAQKLSDHRIAKIKRLTVFIYLIGECGLDCNVDLVPSLGYIVQALGHITVNRALIFSSFFGSESNAHVHFPVKEVKNVSCRFDSLQVFKKLCVNIEIEFDGIDQSLVDLLLHKCCNLLNSQRNITESIKQILLHLLLTNT